MLSRKRSAKLDASSSSTSSEYVRQSSSSADVIDRAISDITNESLTSTRRMLMLVEEANEQGVKTMAVIDEQDEVLDRVDNGLRTIDAQMKETEQDMVELEKCCGLCVLPWQRIHFRGVKTNDTDDCMKPSFSWRRNAKHTKIDDIINEQPRYSISHDQHEQQQQLEKRRPSGYITRLTNDEREAEMENNLQQVNAMVSTLKHMAIDMNTELDVQLPKIDRIAEIASRNDLLVDHASKRLSRLNNDC